MEITGSNVGGTTLPKSQMNDELVVVPGGATPPADPEVPPAASIGDLAKWLFGANGTGGAPPGAPPLALPSGAFNPDDLVILVTAYQAKTSKVLMETSKAEIKVSNQRKQEAHQTAIAKIQEAADKISEAKKKEK